VDITSERLAYWFLRLNGFLTQYNFVVHPEGPDQQGHYNQQTEVDVIGVRFPHRRENRINPMRDHGLFQGDGRVQLILAETKSTRCTLNPSWRHPANENMEKVLTAVGLLPPEHIEAAAAGLYRDGTWTDGASFSVRWVLFGMRPNRTLKAELPEVPQLTWDREVLPFIFQRFFDYRMEKRSHGQWDADAKGLFGAVHESGFNLEKFIRLVRIDPQAEDGSH
jgi:hypothetical protein